METILKTLVGSRAHGLDHENSDYDYRAVHVLPTKKILSIGYHYRPNELLSDKTDETSYEIGHFLKLATSANPSILEVLLSDHQIASSSYAGKMRELLPNMFAPADVFQAFNGFVFQMKRRVKKDPKDFKAAVAAHRVAMNLWELFNTGTFSVKIEHPEERAMMMKIKMGQASQEEIEAALDQATEFTTKCWNMIGDVPNHEDRDMVNDFLYQVRRDFW